MDSNADTDVTPAEEPPVIKEQDKTPSLSDENEASQEHEKSEGSQEPTKSKGGWPKGRKRKKESDPNAPKPPLGAFFRFASERRPGIRQDSPSISFTDMSKRLSQEWSSLSPEERLRYQSDAKKDTDRYSNELEQYKRSDSYRSYAREQQEKRVRDSIRAIGESPQQTPTFSSLELLQQEPAAVAGLDIPIFTEEFLQHNKEREAELRSLRKQAVELEEQNAVLSKRVCNAEGAVQRLRDELTDQRSHNSALHRHLGTLRSLLARQFASLPLPDGTDAPREENIDQYMSRVYQMVLEARQEHQVFLAKVRDAVSKLDISAI